MLKLLPPASIAIGLLTFSSLSAQDERLVNQKGIELGSKSDFLVKCRKAWDATPEFAIIERERFCECAIPIFLSTEAIATTTNPRILDNVDLAILIGSRETSFEELMACSGFDVNSIRLSAIGPEGVAEMKQECAGQLRKEPSIVQSGADPDVLCNCMIDEVTSRDLTLGDVYSAMDPNSPLFNEVFLPCATRSTGQTGTVSHAPSDITGPTGPTTVPVVLLGSVHKVKMKVGGKEQYFIVDSGAEDCIFSGRFMEELRKSGAIDSTEMLPDRDYLTADGRTVRCKRYLVHGFEIGPLRVDRVVVASMDGDIQHLLGKSFLKKFREWRIDEEAKTLTLER